MENKTELSLLIGYIGHKADKLQEMFGGECLRKENEFGYFLRFTDVTETGNEGVRLWTNHFESEEHFYEVLNTKLLLSL
jgi:hypothetical protein